MTLYQKQLTEFSENYYAAITTGIILSSCIGSIAAMLILMDGHGLVDMILLGLVVCVCMWYNASVLAQLKSKVIFNSLILSLVVSITLITIKLF